MVDEEPQAPPEDGVDVPDETSEGAGDVELNVTADAAVASEAEGSDDDASESGHAGVGETAAELPGDDVPRDEGAELDTAASETGIDGEAGAGDIEAETEVDAEASSDAADGPGADPGTSAADASDARAVEEAVEAAEVHGDASEAQPPEAVTVEPVASDETGEAQVSEIEAPAAEPPPVEAAPEAAGEAAAETSIPTEPVAVAAAAATGAAAGPPVGRWLRREARPRPPAPSRYTTEAPEWLAPEFEHQVTEVASPPFGRSPGRLPALVLAVLMSGVFLMFVLIEPTPTWTLLLGAIIAALGTDGVLRSIRHRVFEREGGADTVPHLFLPTLFALAIPLFIEENLQSYWVIPAALLAGIAFVAIVLAEVPAEEAEEDEFRGRARFVSVAMTYFVAFALFSLAYAFDLGLRESLIPIALVSVLLAVGLLREGEVDPLETLLLAGVVGVVVAEARWVLNYLPIDAYPAGLALVLVFYFVTGMVHAYMTRHINITVAAEYTIVTVLGLGLVIAARATGIA